MSNMPRHLIQDRYQLYIGGAWCDASDGATFDSFCPANGERLCSFAEAAKSDVDAAVTAAWNAFPSWRAVPSQERSQILVNQFERRERCVMCPNQLNTSAILQV